MKTAVTANEASGAMKGHPGERLVFSRILGHLEIPRAHMWQESSDCWICDRHRYTLLAVSKSIAQQHMIKPKGKEKDQYIQKIKDAMDRQNKEQSKGDNEYGSDNDDLYYDADDES